MREVYVPKASDWIGAFEAGQQGAMTRRKEESARLIGGAMSRGDYKAAASAAYGSGDYGAGSQIEQVGSQREAAARRAALGQTLAKSGPEQAAQEALAAGDLDYYKELDGIADKQKVQKAKQFGGILRAIAAEPEDAWDDRIAENRATLEALDIPAAEIDFFIKAQPDQRRTLMFTMLSRADMLDKYLDDRRQDVKPDWKEIKAADGSTQWVDFNDRNGGQPQTQAPGAQMAGGNADVDAVWRAAIQQESGGRPGVRGPQTQYGVAEGLTQMLPATAQAMAQKLGLPWRPELMTAATPEAAQYQERLGRAYFDEGLQKYGGDVRKALAYYHGGPDEGIWGPKTRKHVEDVMARVQPARQMAAAAPQAAAEPSLAGGAGNDSLQPYQVASVGATPPPPQQPMGGRVRPGSAAPRPEWVDQPDGSQVNIRTGERKGDRTGAGGYTPKQTNEATVELKGKFEGLPHVKAFRDVQASYSVISSIAKKANPTAADDLSLIFSYMKMLDPGSVVREGEFANAQNTGGVPDQIVNAYNKALSGKRLNPRQRSDFARTAGQIVVDRRGQFDTTANEYRRLAQDVGANPDRIAPDPATWKAKAEKARAGIAKPALDPAAKAGLIREAKEAIAAGAPRASVIQELRKMGVSEGI